MQEQRHLRRWDVTRQARIKLQGAYNFADCYLKDLNFKGAQITLKIKLPQENSFKLNLALSGDIVLELEAFVAWHEIIEGYNVYGLSFSKISDIDKGKIFSFLRRYLPDQIDEKWWQNTNEEGGESMPVGKLADRRVFARFPAQFPIRFLDSDSNQEGDAVACDISAKGLGLISHTKLNARTPLELWIDVPDNAAPLYARGEVSWLQQAASDEYRYGINLEKADLMGLARVLRAKKT